MNNSLKMYRKHNSFVGIRHKGENRLSVLSRIKSLREKIDRYALTPDKQDIVSKACDALLSEPSDDKQPLFKLSEHVIEEVARLRDGQLPRYLFYRYRYEVFPLTNRLDDFPPCLQIEPTSICNYRCVFCYQTDKEFTHKSQGHMGMMTLDLFKRLVDQAEGHCEALTLSSRGDPLICHDIVPMMEYCRDKFLALKLNTNAWFLDEGKSHAILQSGFNTVVFSADAASEPLYSQLRVHGELDRIVNNVRRFREIREKDYPDSGVITRVSGVYVAQEGQDLNEMERFWGDLVDQVAFVEYNPWENTYQRPVNDIVTPCSDLWRRMFVWFDGTVNPCDIDYKSTLAIGNARDSDLSGLWRSEQYEHLRERHLSKERSKLSLCSRCTVL